MNILNNGKGQTIAEILVASFISVILIASALGAFVLTKQIYASNIAEANLQRDANVIMAKIIKGEKEPGGIFRLSEAQRFRIQSINNLQFWGTDNSIAFPATRWYYVDNTGRSIFYHHPTYGGTGDELIYTAPQGASLTLWFEPYTVILPSEGGPGDVYTNIDLLIGVAISQNMAGKNINASVMTTVNIRNHVS